jgi:hypothetical protein
VSSPYCPLLSKQAAPNTAGNDFALQCCIIATYVGNNCEALGILVIREWGAIYNGRCLNSEDHPWPWPLYPIGYSIGQVSTWRPSVPLVHSSDEALLVDRKTGAPVPTVRRIKGAGRRKAADLSKPDAGPPETIPFGGVFVPCPRTFHKPPSRSCPGLIP